MRIRLLTAAALLGTAAPIAGQENQVEPPKTGSVAGVVIDEKSGDRVAKAVIILRRDEQRTVPSGNVSGGRNLYSTGSLFPRTCTEVPGELGRLKGGWATDLGVARCAPHWLVQN